MRIDIDSGENNSCGTSFHSPPYIIYTLQTDIAQFTITRNSADVEEQCSAAAEDDRQSQHRDGHHDHHSEHAQQWQHGTTLFVCESKPTSRNVR